MKCNVLNYFPQVTLETLRKMGANFSAGFQSVSRKSRKIYVNAWFVSNDLLFALMLRRACVNKCDKVNSENFLPHFPLGKLKLIKI